MSEELHNLEVFIGCKFDAVVTYQTDAGVAVNLTGYAAKLGVKREHSDADEVLTLTESSGLTLGGSAGTIDILITAAQTALLSGEYIYSLTLTAPGSDPEHIVSGRIACTPVA